MSLSTGFLSLNNTNLYYEVQGQGAVLVLIHAGIADCRMWDDQFDLLAQHYRVLRYDVRGFGRSPNPAGHYANHQDLKILLDHLDIKQAYLLGASNGGKIAINFTLTHPDKVTALMLVGASVEGQTVSDEIKQGWANVDAAFEADDLPLAVELTLQMWVDGPQRNAVEVSAAVRERVRDMLTDLYQIPEELDEGQADVLTPTAISRLSEIKLPTLVMVGDQDFDDKVLLAQRLAIDIPQAQFYIMSEVAHVPNMEKPAEFNQVIMNFLQA